MKIFKLLLILRKNTFILHFYDTFSRKKLENISNFFQCLTLFPIFSKQFIVKIY